MLPGQLPSSALRFFDARHKALPHCNLGECKPSPSQALWGAQGVTLHSMSMDGMCVTSLCRHALAANAASHTCLEIAEIPSAVWAALKSASWPESKRRA